MPPQNKVSPLNLDSVTKPAMDAASGQCPMYYCDYLFPDASVESHKSSLRPQASRKKNPKSYAPVAHMAARRIREGIVHFHLLNLVQYFRFLVQNFRSLLVPAGLITLIVSTGCGSSNWSASQYKAPPSVADVAAANTGTSSTPSILLFTGTGTSSGDVSAVKTILGDLKLSYATASSSQLNGMSESALKAYKLILFPGGNAITIGKNLHSTTKTNVHNAVVNDGVHYLGICAGAFFADSSSYGYLNLTGVLFDYYEDYYDGIHKNAVEVSQPSGTKLDQYWQDGPELNGWGNIVGKYPDGTAAIVEGYAGKGWVILSGIHAEAPASWRTGMTFTTSVATDNAYAETLVNAALNGTSLSHY